MESLRYRRSRASLMSASTLQLRNTSKGIDLSNLPFVANDQMNATMQQIKKLPSKPPQSKVSNQRISLAAPAIISPLLAAKPLLLRKSRSSAHMQLAIYKDEKARRPKSSSCALLPPFVQRNSSVTSFFKTMATTTANSSAVGGVHQQKPKQPVLLRRHRSLSSTKFHQRQSSQLCILNKESCFEEEKKKKTSVQMSTTALKPYEKTEATPTNIPVTYRKPIPIKKKPLELIEQRRRKWLL